MSQPKYRRVLVKLSGEALVGGGQFGLDRHTLAGIADQIKTLVEMDVAVGIVVGGGNFWRGDSAAAALGMETATAHYAGMLATLINALALQESCEQAGLTVRTQSAITIQAVAEPYIRRRAIRHLEKGRVVIFAAGTGNPFMTTDTAAALRAVEIGAEVLLMAKNGVDGVYDADPRHVPDARKYRRLSYLDALSRRLTVMDSTALSLCMENSLPILVFDIAADQSIVRAVTGHSAGTLVDIHDSHYMSE